MAKPRFLDPGFLDDLAQRLAASVPPGLSALRADLESNLRATLQAGLARLDLVTREEFDVQTDLLKRCRERLEALEVRLAALEGRTLESSAGQTEHAGGSPANH